MTVKLLNNITFKKDDLFKKYVKVNQEDTYHFFEKFRSKLLDMPICEYINRICKYTNSPF